MTETQLREVTAYVVATPGGSRHIASALGVPCAGPNSYVESEHRQPFTVRADDTETMQEAIAQLHWAIAAERAAGTVARAHLCRRCSHEWIEAAPDVLL